MPSTNKAHLPDIELHQLIRIEDQDKFNSRSLIEEWCQVTTDNGLIFSIYRSYGSGLRVVIKPPKNHPTLAGRAYRFELEQLIMNAVVAIDEQDALKKETPSNV